jgi:CheY-like chemotaxis protein
VSETKRVFIVDDRIGDLAWLLDLIRSRGYEVVLTTNEQAARKQLEAVRKGGESYVLAIVDVMVATHDLLDLVALDEKFFEDSRNTGIRLCEYARKELGISPEVLPIVCLTAREDEAVKIAMDDLGIRLFHRAPPSPEESIRSFVEERLPPLT